MTTTFSEVSLCSMKVVVLTGAGISAESGIPTFRGKDGLWKQRNPMELATPEAFHKNPKLVWEWYDWRRQKIKEAKPNKGHIILAKMEKNYEDVCLITQNVDGLHWRAGSKKVIELHGNIWRVKCLKCKESYFLHDTPLREIPPTCKHCGGLLRPGVVWFGESLPIDLLEEAYAHSTEADVFLVVGTSSQVYPAAELPIVAKRSGAKLIEVNLEETPVSSIADHVIRESASTGLEKVKELL